MVNNLKQLLPLLEFNSVDDFYYLQILQRKKENPELGSNSRVIKNYYIRSKEHLQKHYTEIQNICEMFNARASLRLNRRSFTKVAFKALVNVANTIHNGEYKFVGKSYDRACGDGHNEPKKSKKWIIDVDDTSQVYLSILTSQIQELQEDTGYRIITIVPSLSGYHIITNPFNTSVFKELHPNIDIHKDNPTNLYIP